MGLTLAETLVKIVLSPTLIVSTPSPTPASKRIRRDARGWVPKLLAAGTPRGDASRKAPSPGKGRAEMPLAGRRGGGPSGNIWNIAQKKGGGVNPA